MVREFIFIYNARGGRFHELLDLIHKYASPSTYKCSLCMITYNIKMKESWKNFISNSKHEFKFLHIEDLLHFNLEAYKDELPICLEKINDNYQVVIDSKAMNNLKDQEELINLFIEKTQGQ